VHRRRALRVAGVTLAATLGGCLDADRGGESGTPERPWTASDPVESPAGAHHLFVENLTETTENAWLRLRREDGATLVDGRYELPDGRGFEFENVARWARTYTITVAIDGAEPVSMTWSTAACGSGSETGKDNGSRNAAVRVRSVEGDETNRVALVVDDCDALFSPAVPIGPAEAFRLDE
jgi:hypothetical protein